MGKQEFLEQLRNSLSGLPQEDIEERLTFYSEMIDDRVEEGVTEQDAVAAVGTVDQIVAQIVADIPLAKIAKERIKPKRGLKAWEIVLLVLGSPIWLSLGAAAVVVILALYVSLWAIILSLWAAFGLLIVCALAAFVSAVVSACNGRGLTALGFIGAGLVCAGVSVFAFYGCKAATKGTLLLTRKLVLWMKSCFIRKEEA